MTTGAVCDRFSAKEACRRWCYRHQLSSWAAPCQPVFLLSAVSFLVFTLLYTCVAAVAAIGGSCAGSYHAGRRYAVPGGVGGGRIVYQAGGRFIKWHKTPPLGAFCFVYCQARRRVTYDSRARQSAYQPGSAPALGRQAKARSFANYARKRVRRVENVVRFRRPRR